MAHKVKVLSFLAEKKQEKDLQTQQKSALWLSCSILIFSYEVSDDDTIK